MLQNPEPSRLLAAFVDSLKRVDAEFLRQRYIFRPSELLDETLLDSKDRI